MLLHPRSRNSVDYLVNVNTAACANLTGDECHNGQAAFYYQQGCFIGCPTCDHKSGRRQVDLCGRGFEATLNDDKLRSVNLAATPGTALDIYKHNPWRAPGYAPVATACGFAGGWPWGATGAEAGDYVNTTYAHHGMEGILLPPLDNGVVWKIGGQAEVTWQVRNNHGGGYSYRLCPLDEWGDGFNGEQCFQDYPLDFDESKHALVWPNGTRQEIPGAFTAEGTWPKGSQWARLPIPATMLGPRCLPGAEPPANASLACQPWEAAVGGSDSHPCVPCPGTPGSDCSRCDNGNAPSFAAPYGIAEAPGFNGRPPVAVYDQVKVPSTLKPGKYILGWRYDCEATAQIWSNCADITLEL
jgi:hypothetical protein